MYVIPLVIGDPISYQNGKEFSTTIVGKVERA